MLNTDLVVQGGIQIEFDHEPKECIYVKLCVWVRDRVQFSFGFPRLRDGSSFSLRRSDGVAPVLLGCSLSPNWFGYRCLLLLRMNPRLRQYSRFGLRALRIAASTLALVALLRSDWNTGAGALLAWLLFIQVERRWTDSTDSDS